MGSEEARNELLTELDNEWHTLTRWNPVPGLYQQTGVEVVKVRGSSEAVGNLIVTRYEIIVTDEGRVIGTYRVTVEEQLAAVEKGMSG